MCVCVRVCARVCVCVRACMCVRVYVYVCVLSTSEVRVWVDRKEAGNINCILCMVYSGMSKCGVFHGPTYDPGPRYYFVRVNTL